MTHEAFMQRALDLAELGKEWVSPNPMVGCVIVHNGKIIGEGYHQKYGEAHAEVNAVAKVKNKSLLPESTVYVTLEPCAHTGKTPPCSLVPLFWPCWREYFTFYIVSTNLKTKRSC